MLVDDELLVRRALRLMLGGDPSLAVVGEAADGREALRVIDTVRPDLVLIDIRMPEFDGLYAIERAGAAHPDMGIIVMTTFNTDALVESALRLGANGFLLKDTEPEKLIDAIHEVRAGRSILSPAVVEQLIGVVTRGDPSRERTASDKLRKLTVRERDIADAIARGLTNTEIASEKFLSVATVKTHVGRIFDKLQADNRVQVALTVYDSGRLAR